MDYILLKIKLEYFNLLSFITGFLKKIEINCTFNLLEKGLQTEEIETLTIKGHIYSHLKLISKKECKWCTEVQGRNDNMSESAPGTVVPHSKME